MDTKYNNLFWNTRAVKKKKKWYFYTFRNVVRKEKHENPHNFSITRTDLFSHRFGDFFKYRFKFQPSTMMYPPLRFTTYSQSKLSVTSD